MHCSRTLFIKLSQLPGPSFIDIIFFNAASGSHLHLDLADKAVASARRVLPLANVSVRATTDILNVDVAGGVVVTSLVAAVVDGDVGGALGGLDGVGKRHATENRASQYAIISSNQET